MPSKIIAALCLGLIFLISATASQKPREIRTRELEKQKKLGIPAAQCIQIEDKLGQLLYANVDGNRSAAMIDPAYLKMVKDLKIGGVIPHTGDYKKDPFNERRRAFEQIRHATDLPVLIGPDYESSQVKLKKTIAGVPAGTITSGTVGLGNGGGLLDLWGNYPLCLEAHVYLNAFMHRALGLNLALGPTIERRAGDAFLEKEPDIVEPQANVVVNLFNEMGVATTFKHFPYTPDDFSLHKMSKDTRFSAEEVHRRLEIFKRTANRSELVMTTHLFNSKIDPDDMATFSKKWIDILRKEVGFDGLLMTDGLLMISDYSDSMRNMSAKWPQKELPMKDQHVIFAARSILAGHDMVLLEGTRNQTYLIFNRLLQVACQDHPLSEQLRGRILESFDRIKNWKTKNQARLKQAAPIPDDLIQEAGALQEVLTQAQNNAAIESSCEKVKPQIEAHRKKVQALKIERIESAIGRPDRASPAGESTSPAR